MTEQRREDVTATERDPNYSRLRNNLELRVSLVKVARWSHV